MFKPETFPASGRDFIHWHVTSHCTFHITFLTLWVAWLPYLHTQQSFCRFDWITRCCFLLHCLACLFMASDATSSCLHMVAPAGLHLLVPKRTGTGQSEIYAWFHSRCVTQSGGCEVSKYHHRLQIAPKKQNVGLGRWMQGSERVWGRWSTAAYSSQRKIHQEDGRTEKDQKCCIITGNGNTKKTLLLSAWCLVEKKKKPFQSKTVPALQIIHKANSYFFKNSSRTMQIISLLWSE